ncbi:MAG: hypothetical protein IAF58_13510 [Leptolyngbya sp.]|nr:hypothetical protein [Candidatus Melainabacteria bacterium]
MLIPIMFSFQLRINKYNKTTNLKYNNNKMKCAHKDTTICHEIEAIRKSVNGKRILAETALFTFEETFHAAQHMNGGKIISPSAAEHLRLPEVRIEERFRKIAFVGSVDGKLPLRSTLYEIEIPAILHDAGMPFSMIKEHYFFGRRHVKERNSVMNYLAKLASGELKIARNLQN